jgi:hypothetical protein
MGRVADGGGADSMFQFWLEGKTTGQSIVGR